MKKVRNIAVLLCLSMIGVAHAEEQDFIDYRQHVMKSLKEQMTIIGMILEKKAPADQLAAHARVLSLTASTAKLAFETQADGGNAKPEVWSQWQDFAKRLDTLRAVAQEVEQAAKTGDVATTGAKLKGLGCKGCHDTYRVPQ